MATTDVRTAIYRYCNYQERSHQEARDKLYELGSRTPEVEEFIAELIEKGVLNEERFARAIARGKFRMKQWGKQKIIQQLKQQRISEYCIKKALTEIDSDEYDQTLRKLAEKKWAELRTERSVPARKAKTYRYLMQKGYESSMIQDAINEIINGNL
ncbi:MAG: RecX family transcriptional regulator [Sphingobacteriales bacterium]|nr:MAG: RecX family transcriptional regulator [Sphingobacteriales bacterium]